MTYLPSIFVTVDVVLFRTKDGKQEILLIQRLRNPYKNCWALPGGFVDQGEDLIDAAQRELQEETSVVIDALEQLKTYGKPDRDPRGHTISVVYTGETSPETIAVAQDDAKSLQWFSIDELPPLAFDHKEIVADAILKKQAKN